MTQKIGHKEAVESIGAITMICIGVLMVALVVVINVAPNSFRLICTIGVLFIATTGAYLALRLVDAVAKSEVKE